MMKRCSFSPIRAFASLAWLIWCLTAQASDIGVTPVVVHLDPQNDRSSVSVVNSGTETVVMQAEAVRWSRVGQQDQDAPTSDMVINPSVFTLPPGQAQLVRVGLRHSAQSQREGTYFISLREVPPAPRAGDLRLSGRVTVLMALRVPLYVAPVNVVQDTRWQAVQRADGSVMASVRNEGNVHLRVGRMRLRAEDGSPVALDTAAVAVVFPGEVHDFRVDGPPRAGRQKLSLEVDTDQGPRTVPVSVAQR